MCTAVWPKHGTAWASSAEVVANAAFRIDTAFAMSMTIAIIDDDAAVRTATACLLRSRGYAAAAFSSAEDFLESGGACEISCVITDLIMTGMDGIELLKQLTAQGYRIPFIVMTACPENDAHRRALAAGAYGFFVKPYREQAFIDCLKTALQVTG
jgi:FixJ family two-component response regulator